MMATASFVGLSAGKRLMFNSFSSSSSSDLLLLYGGNSSGNIIMSDHGGTNSGLDHHHQISTSSVNAKRVSNSFPSSSSSRSNSKSRAKSKSKSNSNHRLPQPIKAINGGSLKVVEPHHLLFPAASIHQELEEQTTTTTTRDGPDEDQSLEAILLLQKSMLENQWNLCFEPDRDSKIPTVYGSGVSARQRRVTSRRRRESSSSDKHLLSSLSSAIISPKLVHSRFVGGGYVKGVVSDELLSHSQVVLLSNKIKAGLSLEDHKSRLRDRLGSEPSDEQLATFLKISRGDLHHKLIQYSLAREKLAMSNVRLVMSIAQRFDHMGAEMSDLVQGGLIGLLRGIEKFDSSKGFKISTYVYWWIRQGVSRALVDNSRTLRLPAHLHERLGLIRNAKLRLEEKGVTPSVNRIAECLNMSEKKVRNATEAVRKVFSLDRDAFPSLNGLPGESHHSYIADTRLENNPWHGVEEWALKDEVTKLIDAALGKRERQIIRLYYGLDKECLTWEDISKRIGLSRERVRQVGLVALEKLKHMARKRKMAAMLTKQ